MRMVPLSEEGLEHIVCLFRTFVSKIEQNLEGFVKARSTGNHCKSRNGGIRAKGELLFGGITVAGGLVLALVMTSCSSSQLDNCVTSFKDGAKSAAASAVPTEVTSGITAAKQLKNSAIVLVNGKSLTGTLKIEGTSAFYELTDGERVYVMHRGQFMSQPILVPKGKQLPVDAQGIPTPTLSSAKQANGAIYTYYKGVPIPNVTVPATKSPDEVLAKYLQETKVPHASVFSVTTAATAPPTVNC